MGGRWVGVGSLGVAGSLLGGCRVVAGSRWSQGGRRVVVRTFPGRLQGGCWQAAGRERMQATERDEAGPKRAAAPAGQAAASGPARPAGTSSVSSAPSRMAEPPRKAASSHLAADPSPQKRPLEKSPTSTKKTVSTTEGLIRDMSTLGSGFVGSTLPHGSALTPTGVASDGEDSDDGSGRSSTGSTQSNASKRKPPRVLDITPAFGLIVSARIPREKGKASNNVYWPGGGRVVISGTGEISHAPGAYGYYRYPMLAHATPEACEKELDRFKAGMIVQFGRFKAETATVRTRVMALPPVSFFSPVRLDRAGGRHPGVLHILRHSARVARPESKGSR